MHGAQIRSVKGQALAEAIVVIPAIFVFLLLGSALYSLMQADLNTTKAARLAAWQSTIYSAGITADKDVVAGKVKSNIVSTVFNGNRSQYNFDDMGDDVDSSYNFKPLIGDLQNSFGYANTPSGSPSSGFKGAHGTNIGALAGLSPAQTQIGFASVSVPVRNGSSLFSTYSNQLSDCFSKSQPSYFHTFCTGGDRVPLTDVPDDLLVGVKQFHLSASAALLANGMVPTNEENFQNMIRSLSSDGNPLGMIEPGMSVLGFFGFDHVDPGRGPDGLNTVAPSQSALLPTELGNFPE